eukprot:RCo040652
MALTYEAIFGDEDDLESNVVSEKSPDQPVFTDLPLRSTPVPDFVVLRGFLSASKQLQLVEAISREGLFPEGLNQALTHGHCPPWTDSVAELVRENFPENLRTRRPLFDQCIVNRYAPGEGIRNHKELDYFDDGVVGISLLSSCVLTLTPEDEGQPVPVLLQPGDVYIMHGIARYHWFHGIEATSQDVYDGIVIPRKLRISVTLRRLIPHLVKCTPVSA